jgi:hypothetical protein
MLSYKPVCSQTKYTVNKYKKSGGLYIKDSILLLLSNFADSYVEKDLNSNITSRIWILDLMDTTNDSNSQFRFIDKHIYVFSPVRINYVKYDYHNIAIFNNDTVTIFKAINCPTIGDSIELINSFLDVNFMSPSDKENMIIRLKLATKSGWESIMRKLWSDDHDLIFDQFECLKKQ